MKTVISSIQTSSASTASGLLGFADLKKKKHIPLFDSTILVDFPIGKIKHHRQTVNQGNMSNVYTMINLVHHISSEYELFYIFIY